MFLQFLPRALSYPFCRCYLCNFWCRTSFMTYPKRPCLSTRLTPKTLPHRAAGRHTESHDSCFFWDLSVLFSISRRLLCCGGFSEQILSKMRPYSNRVGSWKAKNHALKKSDAFIAG